LTAGKVSRVESVNFDRAAEYYDVTRALPDEAMAKLLGVLAPELAARQPCLEIGVGTGRIALPLHGQGIAMAGADIAEAMLRRLVINAEGVPPVPVPETQTLAGTLRHLEEQVYSWTWPYSRDQVLAASADIRAWARRENVSLDEEYLVEGALEWWAFDLR
jgi:hypothetical protein